MNSKELGLDTLCIHAGELEDKQFKGAISPIYLSTSYEFIDEDPKRYPRNFDTPNQLAVAEKIAAIEHTDRALLFGSGMAALSTMFLAMLKPGDHLVVQNTVYGGTHNFLMKVLRRYNIDFTYTDGYSVADFENSLKPNTRLIHIETPSNPLLTITDIKGVADLAKSKGIITSIDNTFATPVNQIPADLGIDLIIHSATKYFGGHSDILAGAVAGPNHLMEDVWEIGRNLGGNLSDLTVWLLERSMKTLGLRVKKQNKNAQKIAEFLDAHADIKSVYYPGLKSHPEHDLAKHQMRGFGGMMSFELSDGIDPLKFQKSLKLIKASMSLAGIETTVTSPFLTSHALMTPEQRAGLGISDNLIRFSTGIEKAKDLMDDIEQAIKISKKESVLSTN
ncbi:trans-sulfuration enzyme family protein [Aegicerativicinus sediminis]|uniref:trans-sulfuration enzyme family protein n=1 Tax=Aegicerativicinus sediminis TaxID=2893202 RepID=UPI001E4749BA|nr:PLP-dependent aspartate aminotransferase family protein [Aegicerativicinus sediminis]